MAETSKKLESYHMKGENRNGGATIDNLPECLLLQILSFVTTLDAIRCSLVSKNWRNLWQSLESLEFKTDSPEEYKDPFFRGRPSYHNFFCETLCHRPTLPLHKLSICFDYTLHRYISVIDLCTCYAIKFGVVELDLYFFEGDFIDGVVENDDAYNYDMYVFEFSSNINSSVKNLSLRLCYLSVPANTCFESIVSLSLVDVSVEDEMLAELITGCVNLESLDLERFNDMLNLKIYSSKLKNLRISRFSDAKLYRGEMIELSIDICTPCLQSISLISVYAENYSLKCPTPLIEAVVDFPITNDDEVVVSYSARGHEAMIRFPVQRDDFKYWCKVVCLLSEVQCLTISNMWLQFSSLKISISDSFLFNNLNHLELRTGYTKYDVFGLDQLLKLSPLLETMVLNYANCTYENDRLSENLPFRLHIPCLRLIKMKNFRMTRNEINFLEILKRQDLVQKVGIQRVILHGKAGDSPFDSLILDWEALATFLRTKGKLFPKIKHFF